MGAFEATAFYSGAFYARSLIWPVVTPATPEWTAQDLTTGAWDSTAATNGDWTASTSTVDDWASTPQASPPQWSLS